MTPKSSYQYEDRIKDYAKSDTASHFLVSGKIYSNPPNQNKCAFYSLICSDLRKVMERFKLGLFRQIEALACLIHCNGSDQIDWHQHSMT
jgi:hypothetical protein